MTDAEILRLAIAKADRNGWKEPKANLQGPISPHDAIEITFVSRAYYGVIFTHPFARAFWGENFKNHIQQMALEEEPLKYIQQFLLS